MDIGKANLYAMGMIIPIAVIFIFPFLLIWGTDPIQSCFNNNISVIWIFILTGIVMHELLHGITWALFTKKKFKSIRFGINWKFITPYCHCKEPLKVSHYLAGAAMPLIVLGLTPVIISFLSGNGEAFCFGVFFTWSAGGDVIAIFAMRKLKKETLVLDHPEKLGFYIFEKEDKNYENNSIHFHYTKHDHRMWWQFKPRKHGLFAGGKLYLSR
ncbi:MAG: DUF3267 domain-containing protein [Bacteroidales bacterium]|nr:DUF3267 domain-containing protein [Bacteroidales bacterium]